MAVSRRLGAVLRLSSVVVVIFALAATVAVATGQAGNMRLLVARAGHTATAQLDGSLMIAGGTGNRGVIRSLEFFDPVSGTSTPGPRLFEARSGHSAIALADGRVLLTGGRSGDNAPLASSEIYDAAGGTLNPGASLGHARANHTSTLLADGRVLIAGGDAEGVAEIYDPATDRFVNAGRLAVVRSGHSAVRLGDGRVLLVGGYDAAGATAEIFDPNTNTFSAVRGGLKTARVQPTLKLISDGKVQVYGGDAEITMEIYNPAGYFSSRGHLLRDSSMFRSIMYSPGQAALIAIPSAKGKHYAEDALGPASEFERTGHTATEVAARSTMVVVGGYGTTGAALDTITELGSCGGTVTTDLTDYVPGQTVIMSGSGWTPGEQITLNLHRDTNEPPDTVLYATADENGDWINAEYVVQEFDLGVTFVLTATGDSGCVAQTTFTDSTSLQSVSVGAQTPNPVTSGNAATYTVTLSFNGAGTTGCSATLNAVTGTGQTGLPAGTVTNFSPNPVPGHSTSAPTSTLTITTPAGTTPGPYTFTVSANAPNVSGGQGCNGGTVNAAATLVVASAVSATTTTVTCPAQVTYTGSALTLCTANVTGAGGFNQSLTVTYSSNTNAGTANASASFAGDANHAASSDSKTFIIDPAASTTTVTCPAQVTYTGSALTLCTANVTGAGSLNQSLTVTYSNNTNAGTASASASFAGDTNHTASNDSKSFTIDPASSTTTVTCPAHVTYTGSALTPCTANVTGAGSLNQSLTVTYSNNTNAGTASASASFAGDTNHSASNDSKSFTIDPASSTTTVTCPAHVTYTGSALTPCTANVTGAGSLNQALTVTYSNNTNAGTASASASFAGDTNHTASNDSKSFTIDPAASTTTVSCPAHVTYTGSALTPCTANVTGAGSLNQSLTVTYLNNTNAGTASASASFGGDANHAASSDSKTFIIDPATSATTVTCPVNGTYTGAALTPCTATFSTSDGQNGSLSVNYSNNVDAGTATASATYGGDLNHASSSDTKNFTIEPAPSFTAITCPASVTYTGAAQTPCTANATGAGSLNQVLAVTYSNNVDAGTATASASYAGDANHAASSNATTFVIDPAPSVTTLTCPAHVAYTGAAQTPCSANVTGAGGLNQVLSVSYSNNINAGNAGASASFPGDANHAASSNATTFFIDPAPSFTMVTCPASVTYTGAAQTPCSATATGAGGLNQVVTVGYSNNVGAGTATASATFAGDANHQGSSDSKTFIIDPASSTTTVTCPAHVTYTGAALTPCSAVATGVGGLNQPLIVTYSNNVGVGSAGASATYAGDANHTGSSGSTTFLIDPVPSFTTVTCPAQVTYTGLARAPCTAAVTGAGGLNLALAVSYANNVNAGTATASAAYAGDANHFGSSNSASFTITRADASISVNAYSVTYNGASHAATGSATGVQGELLAGLDLGGTVHTAAGSYTDTWTFTDVTGNYNNATGTVLDVIGKADATIVVTPYDVPFDAMLYTATGTAKGVLGETLAGLNLGGTTHSAAGAYNDTWTFTDVTGNYKNTSGQVTDVIEACMATTSISSNFNGTSIAAGRFVWFNSNFSVSGSHTTPVAISFTDQTITSGYFSTAVPDSVVILDPAATTATTTFAGGMWTTRVPASGLAGNTLLSGAPYLVPAGGLRGGINPVTWSGVISTGTPGIKLNWAWGAAVYTSFSGDPGQVSVKPVDDNKASAYKNSDHAGTPESFKAFVTGGARGGGGSNYTGSWSGTDGVTPVCTP